MSGSRDSEALIALVAAMDEALLSVCDSRDQLDSLPATAQDFGTMTAPRRVAGLALLKSIEQLEELIARILRAALLYEQVDLTGFSPRAIADQAEKLGLISSSDAWSDLVRLRNRLVHEYPLPRAQQLARLTEAWQAADDLIAVSSGVVAYISRLNLEGRS